MFALLLKALDLISPQLSKHGQWITIVLILIGSWWYHKHDTDQLRKELAVRDSSYFTHLNKIDSTTTAKYATIGSVADSAANKTLKKLNYKPAVYISNYYQIDSAKGKDSVHVVKNDSGSIKFAHQTLHASLATIGLDQSFTFRDSTLHTDFTVVFDSIDIKSGLYYNKDLKKWICTSMSTDPRIHVRSINAIIDESLFIPHSIFDRTQLEVYGQTDGKVGLGVDWDSYGAYYLTGGVYGAHAKISISNLFGAIF